VENGLLAYVGKGRGGRYEPFHFGASLDAGEVELSDEMFLITADEARKHIEPPRLTSLVVTPAQATVESGKKQTFMARGQDQHGRDIETGKVSWSATGGTIEQDGVFLAAQDEGNFLVTASAGDVQGVAGVTIARLDATPPPPIKPPVQEVTALCWEGEIPPQKWMNFYTRVLSKFAAGKGLTLTVRFALSLGESIPPHKIEETKVALRELGLHDEIETS
jgi:hypothetical protein